MFSTIYDSATDCPTISTNCSLDLRFYKPSDQCAQPLVGRGWAPMLEDGKINIPKQNLFFRYFWLYW